MDYPVEIRDIDKNFMMQAFEIAFGNLGNTSPNPSVGAVIVKNDRVISSGGTFPCGYDHAEAVAIKSAKEDLNGTSLYVSLEPCCQYGKTPPCTELIIKSGISRVYVPILDPNPAVSGNGIDCLARAGVEVVIMRDFSNYAFDLIRPFEKYILKKKSYIIHKSAITLDGKTASKTGDSKWISSDYSRYIVHRLRSRVDAIIIGSGTYSSDNPSLNVRMDTFDEKVKGYFMDNEIAFQGRDNLLLKMLLHSSIEKTERNPMRIVLGLPERINPQQNFFHDDNYLFFTGIRKKNNLSAHEDYLNVKKLLDAGKLKFLDGDSSGEQIHHLLGELHELGVMFVMLEGGSKTSGSFFDAGELDQFFYFIAPLMLGNGLPVIKGDGVSHISESLKLNDISTMMIKDDLLFNAYKEKCYVHWDH